MQEITTKNNVISKYKGVGNTIRFSQRQLSRIKPNYKANSPDPESFHNYSTKPNTVTIMMMMIMKTMIDNTNNNNNKAKVGVRGRYKYS